MISLIPDQRCTNAGPLFPRDEPRVPHLASGIGQQIDEQIPIVTGDLVMLGERQSTRTNELNFASL